MAAAAAPYRTLEVTLISAKDLKDVNFLSKLETYAVVSIPGFPYTEQRTRTDREGRKNPTWNATFRFNIPRSADLARLTLEVLIRTERPLGDRDVGTVSIRLSTLESNSADASDSPTFLSYPVRRPCGNRGMLSISYKFGEPDPAAVSAPMAYPPSFLAPQPPPPGYPHLVARDAITAYPVGVSAPYNYPVQNMDYSAQGITTTSRELQLNYPPSSSPYGYRPPPPAAYGYGYRPQEVYEYSSGAYPLAPPLPPPQQQQQRAPETTAKKGFGMRPGAGLVGGAVGGVLIGGALSETAAAYDAGCGSGFDDSAYDF